MEGRVDLPTLMDWLELKQVHQSWQAARIANARAQSD